MPDALRCRADPPAPPRRPPCRPRPHRPRGHDQDHAPAAPSDRAAPLRRGRGARRRRPLGGALPLDPATPRGRLGRLLPLAPTVRPSSAPRPWCSARTTRSTTPRPLDVLIHPADRAPGRCCTTRLTSTGSASQRAIGPADDLGLHRQPRLRGRRSADRPAGDHPLGLAQPALRARPDDHHRRRRTLRRRRRPDHERRRQRRHRHGAAPRGPARRTSSAPARCAAKSSTTPCLRSESPACQEIPRRSRRADTSARLGMSTSHERTGPSSHAHRTIPARHACCHPRPLRQPPTCSASRGSPAGDRRRPRCWSRCTRPGWTAAPST